VASVSVAGRVARTVCFLAVLGLLTVVLIGPLLAVIGALVSVVLAVILVVVPLALVGLLVWGTYQAIAHDPKAAWQTARGHAAALGRKASAALVSCAYLVRWGVLRGRSLFVRVKPVARTVGGAALDLAVQAADYSREQAPVVLDACGRGCAEAARGGKALAVKARPAVFYVGGLFLEVLAGAGVGALLAALVSLGHPDFETRLILGGAIGAAIGLLVAAARGRPQQTAERVA
jgi:hypothetical protein